MAKDTTTAEPRQRVTGTEDCVEAQTARVDVGESVTIASAHYHKDYGIWVIVLDRNGAESTASVIDFGDGELLNEDGSYEDSPLNLLVDLLPIQWPLFVLNDEAIMAHDYWRHNYLSRLLASPEGWGMSTGGLKEFLHDNLAGRKAKAEFDPNGRPVSVKTVA